MSEDIPSPDEKGNLHLTPQERRNFVKALISSFVRILLGLLLIIIMMRLVPENPDSTLVIPILVAVGGIAIYAWFFNRQIKGVYRAHYPNLRAAEALFLVAVMFLAIFSIIYVMISESSPESFTEPLDRFTAYYFSLTVLATVGFGDITPVTTMARSVTMIQMTLDLVFIAGVIRVMSTVAKKAKDRQRQATGSGGSA